MLVRVYLAQQQYAQAIETLERFREHLDRPGDIDTTLEFLALYVVAMYHGGKREQAIHVAARLLAQTEPEGTIRVYLDAGFLMKHALFTFLKVPQVTESSPAFVPISRLYISRLLAAFEQEERRSTHGREASSTITNKTLPHSLQKADSQTPIEPLSPGEQRVLRLLVAGHTYAEMAEALVVSPNTIKSQVGSIYRKLNVRSRLQAYTAAQRLRLL